MDTNYASDIVYELTIESIDFIQPPITLSKETINYILDNIQFNYLLIIFTMGCFTSLIFCEKKKNIIHPSDETYPVLSKV